MSIQHVMCNASVGFYLLQHDQPESLYLCHYACVLLHPFVCLDGTRLCLGLAILLLLPLGVKVGKLVVVVPVSLVMTSKASYVSHEHKQVICDYLLFCAGKTAVEFAPCTQPVFTVGVHPPPVSMSLPPDLACNVQ